MTALERLKAKLAAAQKPEAPKATETTTIVLSSLPETEGKVEATTPRKPSHKPQRSPHRKKRKRPIMNAPKVVEPYATDENGDPIGGEFVGLGAFDLMAADEGVAIRKARQARVVTTVGSTAD